MPDYPNHIIKRGVISLNVKGKDETPLELQEVKISGDNTIQVKISDGGKISSVKARLLLNDDPEKSFLVELNNDGKEGDRAKADLVFSKKSEEKGFGLYKVKIEAEDAFGNKMIKEWPEIMVVH